MAPCDGVRVSVSLGLGLDKDTGFRLLIRWSQVRILHVLPLLKGVDRKVSPFFSALGRLLLAAA